MELERYNNSQKIEIQEFLVVLASRTRKSKKISDSRKLNIIKSWDKYDIDVVIETIRTFIKMNTTPAQGERYMLGIMRNKQKEKDNRKAVYYGTYRANNGKCNAGSNKAERQSEGERLQKFAVQTKPIECDF